MKQTASIALATWMLEHLTPQPYDKALSGDLLEEFQSGRSAGWYRRQVVFAITVRLFNKSRDSALLLAFSTTWSMLYPAWQFLAWKSGLAQAMIVRSRSLDWPYSSLLALVGDFLSPILCIWIGFFVYLLLRREKTQQLTCLRMFGSLSLSLNILFVSTIGLLHHLASSGIDLRHMVHENSYLSPRHIAISIPVALSLFFAIWSAQRHPRRRHNTSLIS